MLLNCKKNAILNTTITKSTVAFFIKILPQDNIYFKTVLKYIFHLENNGIGIDLYFETKLTIDQVALIENELNTTKHNFYQGLTSQRYYDIIVASSEQVAKNAYMNNKYCDKIVYFISGLEYPFWLNKYITESNSSFYCFNKSISQQLHQNFPSNYIQQSFFGYQSDIYFDMNTTRSKSVVIVYHNKLGKLSQLIENIVIKLSQEKIRCYIFPDEIPINNKYIHNLGKLDGPQLNFLYNKCIIGMIFSNSNRIEAEMVASGLKVLKYDSTSNNYDSIDVVTKINTNTDIVSLVGKKIKSKYNHPNTLIQQHTFNKELHNLLTFFRNLSSQSTLSIELFLVNKKIKHVVYASAKTGSTTLANTFNDSIHLHGLFFYFLYYHRNKINVAEFKRKKPTFTMFDIFDKNIKEFNTDRLFLYDSYRTPIERKISAWFQQVFSYFVVDKSALQDYINQLKNKQLYLSFNTDKLTVETFHNYIVNNIDHFIEMFLWTWFITAENYYAFMEYRNIKDFNISDQDYYQQIDDKYTYIILKFNNIKNWDSILSKLHNTNIKLNKQNTTKDKISQLVPADFYQRFKEKLTIPTVMFKLIMYADFDELYKPKMNHFEIMKKFLSKTEIKNYIQKWENKSVQNIPENLFDNGKTSNQIIKDIFEWKKSSVKL